MTKPTYFRAGAVLEINGKPGLWTPGIFGLFEYHVGPRMAEGETISQANYYEPRPYRNEYEKGWTDYGFTYTVQPGNRVAYVRWPMTTADHAARVDWSRP